MTSKEMIASRKNSTISLADPTPPSSCLVPKRSKICSVCGGNSETFHLNYGAAACFSCRAFFRRTVQQQRQTKLVCRSDSNCPINVETRRRCQRCRYAKCLAAGMNPGCVLSEDDKRKRFKNLQSLKQKRRLQPHPDPADTKAPKAKNVARREHDHSVASNSSASEIYSRGGAIQTDNVNSSQGHLVSGVNTPPEPPSCLHPRKAISSNAELSQYESQVPNAQQLRYDGTLEETDRKNEEGAPQHLESSVMIAGGNHDDEKILEWTVQTLQQSRDSWSLPDEQDQNVRHGVTETPLSRNGSLDVVQNTHVMNIFSASASTNANANADNGIDMVSSKECSNASTTQNLLPTSPYVNYDDYDPDRVPVHQYNNSNSRVRKRMLSFLAHIRHTWSVACHRVSVDGEVLSALTALHQGYGGAITSGLLRRHLISFVAKLFREYAFQQPEFASLSRLDQRRLLCRNAPLFVQYLLGRYFCAPTAYEQLHWILACQVPEAVSQRCLGMSRITLHKLNAALGFFRDGADLHEYETWAKALNKPILLRRCNCLISLACLYQTDYHSILDQPDEIDANLAQVFLFAGWAHEVFHCATEFDLKDIVENMEKMVKFFDANMALEEPQQHLTELKREVALPYTNEEDYWLLNQFDHFSEAYASVSVGQDVIEETVMFSLDVPLGKSYTTNILSCFAERCRRIMSRHPEFTVLSAADQVTNWRANLSLGLATIIARMDSLRTGNQQLRFLLGEEDSTHYRSWYDPVLDRTKMKRMTIRDAAPMPDEATAQRLECGLKCVGLAMADVETFKLLVLVSLFNRSTLCGSADASGDAQEMGNLQRRYLDFLQRKLENRVSVETLSTALTGIKELARVISKKYLQH